MMRPRGGFRLGGKRTVAVTKAGSDDDATGGPDISRLPDKGRNGVCGCRDDGEVGRERQVC